MTQNDKQEMINYLQEIGATESDALGYLRGWVDSQNDYEFQAVEATDEELQAVVNEYLESV